MKQYDIKNELLSQIERYLNSEISKEDYADIAEAYYTNYVHLIKNSMFYEVFSKIIPDACLVYVDEPGLNMELSEKLFREQLELAYSKLKVLL